MIDLREAFSCEGLRVRTRDEIFGDFGQRFEGESRELPDSVTLPSTSAFDC